MKINPDRLLDVGVGFGRWGIITREFCDVWNGRMARDKWNVRVEGVEGFAPSIDDYHQYFYNKIHLGDFLKLMPELEEKWNVVVFDDVLEHFEKEDAVRILNWALDHSDYVLVNIPLGSSREQEFVYENSYEKLLSVWEPEDFQNYHLCRSALSMDYNHRPFGSFVLSYNDPKDLSDSLFSANSTSIDTSLKASHFERTNSEFLSLQQHVSMLTAELETIRGSRGYRILHWLQDSRFSPFIKHILRWLMPERGGILRAIFNPGDIRKKIVSVPTKESVNSLTTNKPASGSSIIDVTKTNTPQKMQSKESEFSITEQEWLENPNNPLYPLSVQHPNWLGIHHAAEQLFSSLYDLEDTLDEDCGLHYARLFAEARCPAVVIQGFPFSYIYLINGLKKVAPKIPIFVIWHGSFMQAGENTDWYGFNQVDQLCRSNIVKKWGFVKKGMAEIVAKTGVRTGFVMNYIRQIPERPSTPLSGGPFLGMWAIEPIWRKLPYAMLAAITQIPNAHVFCVGQNQRAKEFAHYFNLDVKFHDLLPYPEVLKKLAQMDLNLYITMSETSGMVPLESFSVGAPCLYGPNTHYFEDYPYLLSRLMVNYPDRSEVISSYIDRALAERDQIVKAYIEYAPGYNDRARKLLEEFLEIDID